MSNKVSRLKGLGYFLRFEYLPGPLIAPLLGWATAGGHLTYHGLAGIIGGGFAFHFYVGILNDIVDLPLDRTNPARVSYPLVNGTISTSLALFITLLQIPVAGIIIFLIHGSAYAYISMGMAFLMMTIYNVWSKRSRFPVLLDFIQGIGFCSLVIYGASLSGNLTRLTWMAFSFGIIWMMLLNVLGGIRDLQSDRAFGVCTTPIYFGAHSVEGNKEKLTDSLRYYGYILQILTVTGGILVILQNDLNYAKLVIFAMLTICFIYAVASIYLLHMLFKMAEKNYKAMLWAGYTYLGVSAAVLLLTILPAMPLWVAVIEVLAFVYIYRNYRFRPI